MGLIGFRCHRHNKGCDQIELGLVGSRELKNGVRKLGRGFGEVLFECDDDFRFDAIERGLCRDDCIGSG